MIDSDRKYIDSDREYRTVHLISGEWKAIKVNSIVGYCNCDTHKGHVTVSLMKNHQCIEKKCPFLDIFSEYPYWQSRIAHEKSEYERKLRIKEKQDQRRYQEEADNRDCRRKLERARQIAAEKNYPIVVVRVARSKRKDVKYRYVLNYISDAPFDDWEKYFKLVKELSIHMGGRYLLKRVKLPNGNLAVISDIERIPALRKWIEE